MKTYFQKNNTNKEILFVNMTVYKNNYIDLILEIHFLAIEYCIYI